MQDFGGNTGDIDDDEGGGLVSNMFLRKIVLDLLIFFNQITHISFLLEIVHWALLMHCNSHI